MRKVKLWDRRKASPSRLSGGQKQRLATADALAGLPACLVLDEPTAMLDPDSRKEVINIVKELNRKEGMTIILITHHTDEVVDADRIVLMKDGKIIGDDIPKKIFADYELLKRQNGYSAGCRVGNEIRKTANWIRGSGFTGTGNDRKNREIIQK